MCVHVCWCIRCWQNSYRFIFDKEQALKGKHCNLVFFRRVSFKCVRHKASVRSLGDKGMPWSHNLKAQEAEGTEQRSYKKTRDLIPIPWDKRTQGLTHKQRHHPFHNPLRNAVCSHGIIPASLPLSSLFLWKQMNTCSTWSCSSANSRRTAKLKTGREWDPFSPPQRYFKTMIFI